MFSLQQDMQRKNDDLKSKFEHLESAVGVLDDFGVDAQDMIMLNGIDKKKPPPRMFCDICKYKIWRSYYIVELLKSFKFRLCP